MITFRLTLAGLFLSSARTRSGKTSFCPDSATPDTPQVTSTSPVSLGLKLFLDVPGYVTGIQFYKGTDNTGTHVGSVWSSTGAKLASVTFGAETSSGWQQANFSSPVSIAANTMYVISYTAPNGHHAQDQNYSLVFPEFRIAAR